MGSVDESRVRGRTAGGGGRAQHGRPPLKVPSGEHPFRHSIPVRVTDPSVAFHLHAVPLAFVGVVLFLLAVALAACLHPARRALHADPMSALKAE